MDLLFEAKKSNKDAFNKLIENYRHIYYKITRMFFHDEYNVKLVIEKTLHFLYKNLVEVKNSDNFLVWSIENLISTARAEQKKLKDSKYNVDGLKSLSSGIAFEKRVVSSISSQEHEEYELYRSQSIVEEYLTSIKEELRLPALLYYYANLKEHEIVKVTGLSAQTVENYINEARIKLFEIIENKEVDLYYDKRY